jgi:rhodanese-related sulfurtransferase
MATDIGTEQAQKLHADGAQFVEVLPAAEFDQEHLPGAVNLTLRALEHEAVERLVPARPVVVYCWDYQ